MFLSFVSPALARSHLDDRTPGAAEVVRLLEERAISAGGCQHPEDDHDEAGCTHTSVERGRLVGSTIPHWPSLLDGLRFR